VTGLDTLYVASDNDRALTRFSLVGGTCVSNGTIGEDRHNYYGLTGSVSGNTVNLYATRDLEKDDDDKDEDEEELRISQFVSLVDLSGYNGAFTGTPILRATADHKTAFRGIAFSPVAVPEPSAILFGGLVCAVIGLTASWRRIANTSVPNA
jgi:hypothetical protein